MGIDVVKLFLKVVLDLETLRFLEWRPEQNSSR